MKNTKKTLKAIVLSMVLAAGMLLPMNIFAQDDSPGGLLNYDGAGESHNTSLFGKGGGLFDGLSLQNFGEDEDELTLQNFGEEAPLGSGWLILMASGAGYAALKSRKKQNTRKK
jgi:hypothetical protein